MWYQTDIIGRGHLAGQVGVFAVRPFSLDPVDGTMAWTREVRVVAVPRGRFLPLRRGPGLPPLELIGESLQGVAEGLDRSSGGADVLPCPRRSFPLPQGRRLEPLASGLTEHNVMVGSLKRMSHVQDLYR